MEHDGTLPLSANKIVSLITNAAQSSNDDIAYIQRKLTGADVRLDLAMGCLATHLTERMHSLLLRNTQGRSTHEQRDTLKQQACVLGRLASTAGDADLIISLLSSLRVCDVARSLLTNNRSVELHFFVQWLCVLVAPLQGQLHECSGTRSDVYDLYTETNLRYVCVLRWCPCCIIPLSHTCCTATIQHPSSHRIAYPTQVALLDLLLMLYDETDAPALLTDAVQPGNGWTNATTVPLSTRLHMMTPRAPPRSAPLPIDLPEPDLPTSVRMGSAVGSAVNPGGMSSAAGASGMHSGEARQGGVAGGPRDNKGPGVADVKTEGGVQKKPHKLLRLMGKKLPKNIQRMLHIERAATPVVVV